LRDRQGPLAGGGVVTGSWNARVRTVFINQAAVAARAADIRRAVIAFAVGRFVTGTAVGNIGGADGIAMEAILAAGIVAAVRPFRPGTIADQVHAVEPVGTVHVIDTSSAALNIQGAGPDCIFTVVALCAFVVGSAETTSIDVSGTRTVSTVEPFGTVRVNCADIIDAAISGASTGSFVTVVASRAVTVDRAATAATSILGTNTGGAVEAVGTI